MQESASTVRMIAALSRFLNQIALNASQSLLMSFAQDDLCGIINLHPANDSMPVSEASPVARTAKQST